MFVTVHGHFITNWQNKFDYSKYFIMINQPDDQMNAFIPR